MDTASRVHWHGLLFTTTAFLLSLQWSCADFIVTLDVTNYTSIDETDSVCCTGISTCSSPCNTSLFICIRSSGSPLPTTRDSANCPIFSIDTGSGGNYHITSQPWPGAVQILIFVGDRVELFQIEYEDTAAQNDEAPSTDTLTPTGSLGSARLTLVLDVRCERGFHGPNCDCQNTNDSTGHFTCTREGKIECLEGYQNPNNNCTECTTSIGCSDMGGFCELPGECICHKGYTGENCTLLVNVSISKQPSVSTSMLDIQISSSEQLSVVPISSSSTTVLLVTSSIEITANVVGGTQSPASTVSTSVSLSSVNIQTDVSSPVSISSSVAVSATSSVPVASVSSPTLDLSSIQSTQGPPLTTMTPETTPRLSTSDLSSIVLPSSAISSIPPSSVPLSPSTSVMPSLSSPITSSPFVGPPMTTNVPTTTPGMLTTTIQQLSSTSSLILPTTTIIQTPLTSTIQTQTIVSPITTVTVSTSSTIATVIPTTTIITDSSMSPTRPLPTSSTTAEAPSPPADAPSRAGNEAVIAGTVVVIVVVVVLVLVTIPCVYLIVKRNKNNKRQQSTVFLDQVYNAPVTFVNPKHEGVAPRSPQLLLPGNDKLPFHEVDYREHVPYAETGPSSDHTQSPEHVQVHELQSTEATIIANTHSLSQTSDSPQPSTPAASSHQRRSGLGFDYRDDPVGDTYLSDQYTEQLQPRSMSGQSSPVHGRSESSHSPGNRQTSSPHLTVPSLPPRGPPMTAPKPTPRANGREQQQRPHHRARPEAATGTGEADEDNSNMKRRVSDYLEAALKEGEKRQNFSGSINFFTDISLDMTTQTEL